jgi:hypothetical protein
LSKILRGLISKEEEQDDSLIGDKGKMETPNKEELGILI